MESLVRANLLAVGINGEAEILDELPIRTVSVDSAAEAVRCIRNERFESVLSKWHLRDVPDGLFLRRLRMVKPNMTTIVIVSGDDLSQEINARSIGVSAVLTEDCGDEFLLQTVASVLGIEVPVAANAITEIRPRRTKDYPRVIH
jgi:DNA-binding NarL/FixJ family response regulator